MSFGKIALCVGLGGLIFWLTGGYIVAILDRLLIATVVSIFIIWAGGFTIDHSAVAFAWGDNAKAEAKRETTIVNNLPEQSGNIYTDQGAQKWKQRGRRSSS